MARSGYRGPNTQPRTLSGKIGFMPPDGIFLAAKEIVLLVPLLVRIREVVQYPAGTKLGGHGCREPFNALLLDGQNGQGEWGPRTKPMRLNPTQQMKLFTRFGEQLAWWTGQEITLDLAVTNDPSGGRKSGFKLCYGIVVAPTVEELDEDYVRTQMQRAVRGECPYHDQAPVDPPPETPPQQNDDIEPPEGWKSGDGPDKESTNGHADMDT